MNITIQNAEATVTCRTHGAELLSYKTVAGKEYMWQKDPAYWQRPHRYFSRTSVLYRRPSPFMVQNMPFHAMALSKI